MKKLKSEKSPEVKLAELSSQVNWDKVDPTTKTVVGMLQFIYLDAARDTQRALNYASCRISTLFFLGIAMLVSRYVGMAPRGTMITLLTMVLVLYLADTFAAIGFRTVEDRRYSTLEEHIKSLDNNETR